MHHTQKNTLPPPNKKPPRRKIFSPPTQPTTNNHAHSHKHTKKFCTTHHTKTLKYHSKHTHHKNHKNHKTTPAQKKYPQHNTPNNPKTYTHTETYNTKISLVWKTKKYLINNQPYFFIHIHFKFASF